MSYQGHKTRKYILKTTTAFDFKANTTKYHISK
jgi:hypothetical protein